MDTWGFRVTLALTVGLGCVWAAATLVPSAFVLGASFGVYALFRTFTFNFFFAFLADSLGFRFFGILAGASFFVAGVSHPSIHSFIHSFIHSVSEPVS